MTFASCSKTEVPIARVTWGDGVLEPYNVFGTTAQVVKVFYATDRKKTNSKEPSEMFSSERGRKSKLTYGTCEVSIPIDHRTGELEEPSIFRLEFSENPKKHIVLRKVIAKGKNKFFSELAAQVGKLPEKKLFIFIHGYWVTFKDAARRTAQLCYDLKFNGAPIFFSWPSQGTPSGYIKDESNIKWATRHIKDFISDVADHTDAENIYLIAHSMGNRAMTEAFADLILKRPDLRKRFREVILAAPDIDAEVFKEDIAPRIMGYPSKITLYVSSKDMALTISRRWHGYQRLGENFDDEIVKMPEIETVDVTNVDTGLLGHSYYGDNTSMLSDLYHLITEGLRPPQRFELEEVKLPLGKYWKFKKY